MMLMSNSASSVVASPATVSHDATFVCPSPASSFTPYIINSNSPSLISTPSSSTLSLCSYPTLKQECHHQSSSSTVRITSWPPVESIFPIGPAPHFIPAALVRLASKASHDDNLPYAVLQLNKRESTIGRDQCDLAIEEVEISRKHALIKYEHNHWWIVDLKSTNGIFIHGARAKPETPILLRDGSIISFGPESTCNFKYVFRESFGVISKHLGTGKFPGALVPPPPPSHMVDQSGYETATSGMPTQEMLPPHPLPPPPQQQAQAQHLLHYQSVSSDLLYQLDYTRAEVGRLRSDRSKLEAQLVQQKDIVRNMGRDFEYNKLKLAEKEKRTCEKSQNLDTLIAKYRTLCGQLEETQKVASQSRSQSDVEFVVPSGGGLSQSTSMMSSVLKEMTCSICTEYLIAPTSLNCSHVFCAHCIDKWCHEYRAKYNSISNGICPVCRKEVQCQAQVLVLENIINTLLDSVLDEQEKQDRAAEIEKRRQAALEKNPCGLPINGSGGTSSPNSLGSFIQQILAGFPLRSRRQSIVITSDDSDEDDDDDDIVQVAELRNTEDPHLVDLAALQEGARRIRRLSDRDVIALEDDEERPAASSSPEVIGLQDEDHHEVRALSSDEEIEEEYDFSFTLSDDRAGGRRQRRRHNSNLGAAMPRIALGLSLDSGEDSNDDEVEEILMLGDDSDLDDDSSNDSFLSQDSSGSEELFLFDLDDHHDDEQQQQRSSSRNNTPIEPIVISDSEESQLQAIQLLPASQQQQARRSSMIILSDSEDSLLPVLSTAAAVTSGPSTSSRRSSRSRQNGLSTSEIVEISPDQAAPGGGNGRRRGSSDSGNDSHHQQLKRAHTQHSRAHRQNRAHQPYNRRNGGRTSQNQNLSATAAAAATRRATLCA